MAYNDLDITTVHGNTITGPLWRISGGITTDLDLDVDLSTVPNAVCLGDASSDGTDFEIKADSNDVVVWGNKKVRTIYSNFSHTITIRLANSTDSDALETFATVTTVSGGKKVAFKPTQTGIDGYVIDGTTDDGKRALAVISYGQPDPNLSFTWSDEDITVYEVALGALVKNNNTAFYLLIEESAS